MKPCEIHVKQCRVLLDKCEEVLLRKLIFFFVQIIAGEEEAGILLGQTGHVRLDFRVLPAFLKTFDCEHTALAHTLLFTTLVALPFGEDVGLILIKRLGLFIGSLHPAEYLTGRHVVISLLPLIVFFLLFGLFINDVFFLDLLVFGSEVVGELIFANILEEGLLNEHLIEFFKGIAEELSRSTGTILSSSEKLTPPVFSKSYISNSTFARSRMSPLIITSKASRNCSKVITPFLEESNWMKIIYPMSPLEWKKMSKV